MLLDAPCSGIGTWPRNPDARWRTRPQQIMEAAERQARLLDICAARVRPGGCLVYAVCTLTREETELAVRRFLASRADFAVAPFPHPLTGADADGLVWIWPWEGPGNGMFVAKLVRTE